MAVKKRKAIRIDKPTKASKNMAKILGARGGYASRGKKKTITEADRERRREGAKFARQCRMEIVAHRKAMA